MTILEKNKIDIMHMEKNICVLTISDHLKWDDEHFYALQDKVNLYIHAIEDGLIENNDAFEGYIIRLVYKYAPSSSDLSLLGNIKKMINSLGITFQYGSINDV